MNALEAVESHSTESPEILVFTRSEGSEGVILSVSDTGPGIEPDHLTSIFDSFHTTKTGGLGMGLSICKSIAEEHGGKIWAENRHEGGSTFFFNLPSKED
jgi:signal transduction histidine kinase